MPLVAELVPLAVCVRAERASLFAVFVCVAVCPDVAFWVATLPPVVPLCEGVDVFVWVLLAVDVSVLVGVEFAAPEFVVDPPVAVTEPDWLKLTPSVLVTTPPT